MINDIYCKMIYKIDILQNDISNIYSKCFIPRLIQAPSNYKENKKDEGKITALSRAHSESCYCMLLFKTL